jgi:hypothetical protein
LRATEWRTTGLDEAWRGALHAVAMRSGVRRAAARKRVNRMEDPWADMGDSYAATRIVGFAREFWSVWLVGGAGGQNGTSVGALRVMPVTCE